MLWNLRLREKKKLVGFLPPTMFCAYAHTSSIWLMFGLMTQWYTSLSGSLHCLEGTSHFVFTAASLQLSSLSGQPFTSCTVDLVTSHELLPATNVCKFIKNIFWLMLYSFKKIKKTLIQHSSNIDKYIFLNVKCLKTHTTQVLNRLKLT